MKPIGHLTGHFGPVRPDLELRSRRKGQEMKRLILLLIPILLFCSCATQKLYAPRQTVDVKANMELINQTISEIDAAIDILFDESLSIDERYRQYMERMKEINEGLK